MKLISDQLSHGLRNHNVGQTLFASLRQSLSISKASYRKVSSGLAEPIRVAIFDSILTPIRKEILLQLVADQKPASIVLIRPAHPAFRYYGGKWRIAPWIIEQFPPHNHYVEPFAGAASVLLRKLPSTLETINDLNQDIVNYFQILRDHPEELVNKILLTPWSRNEYMKAFQSVECSIERARRWWVMMQQGIAASPKAKGWRCCKDNPGRMPEFSKREKCLQNLRAIARRLTRVQIECRPALELIAAYDRPDTLFYVDPPYVAETRSQTQRYAIESSDNDHRQLAEVLLAVKGMVVVSGYRCNLYDELYPGWDRKEKQTGGNSGSSRIECLWLSPRTKL